MPARYRKYLEFLVLLLVAVAIVWWFGRKLDWAEVKASLITSEWRLIPLAALAVLAGYLWRAIRWRAFLAPLTEARLREIWIATTVGYAAVLVIGRAGEIVRPLALPMRDHRVRPAASFVTIFIERIYDSITVMLLFAVSLLWFTPAAEASELARARLIGFLIVGLLVVTVGVLVLFRARARKIIDWFDRRVNVESRLAIKLKRGVLNVLEQLATALAVLSNARALTITAGWSVALWLSVALGNLIVFRAFGLPFGFSQTLFVLGWSMIGSAVPTPGGAAGAFHAVTGAAIIMLGVPKDQAAAVAIILHLVDFGPAALFGFFYFLRGDVNISRLRALISANSAPDLAGADKTKGAAAKRLEVASANK